MPSHGPFLPGASDQDNLGQHFRLNWDIPSRIEGDDGEVASAVDVSQGGPLEKTTSMLVGTDFGFALDPDQVPVGITVTVRAKANISVAGFPRDGVVELIYLGEVVGAIPTGGADWTSSFTTRTFGDASELWGWSPSRSEINDSSFGVRYDCIVPRGSTAEIDWIKIEVEYATSTGVSFAMAGGIGSGGEFPRGVFPAVTFSGGIGVGFPRWPRNFNKVAFTGGVGAGNAAWSLVTGSYRSMTGGIGVGYGTPTRHVKFTTGGGVGAGNEEWDALKVQTFETAGGIGAGNSDPLSKSIKKHTAGGVGAGGAFGYTRNAYRVSAGGVGVGNAAWVIAQGKWFGFSGGLGVGNGEWTATRSRTFTMSGGIAAGAGFRQFGNTGGPTDDGGDDWGDDRDKSHRGAFTRREVITAIKAYLEATVLGGYTVYVATNDDDMNKIPPGDRFAVIMLGASRDEQPNVSGGGLYSATRVEPLNIRVYSSLSADQLPRSSMWTLRQDKGALERARKLRRELHMHDLMDASGWLMLIQPMRSTMTGEPRATRDNPQWAYFQETFEVCYLEHLG